MYSPIFKGFDSAQGFKKQGCPAYIFLTVNAAPALTEDGQGDIERVKVQGHPSVITKAQ